MMKQSLCIVSLSLLMAMAANAQAVTTDSTVAARDSAVYKEMELDNVDVKARRKLIKTGIDRISYDVEHDKDAKTKNTLEILKKVPLVAVSGMDKILVRGGENFKVYKNGHLEPAFSGANLSLTLKSIPATAFKRIEVITTPGAKEDAEGSGIILNLVTADKSFFDGCVGNVEPTLASYGSYSGSGYVLTQKGKWTTSLNAGMSHSSSSLSKSKRRVETSFLDSHEKLVEEGHFEEPKTGIYASMAGSYDINQRNLLTYSIAGNYNTEGHTGTTDFSRYNAAGDLAYKYRAVQDKPESNNYDVSARLDYQHKTKREGESVTLSYMWVDKEDKNNMVAAFEDMASIPVPYTGYETNGTTHFAEHTVQVDYVRPLGKMFGLDMGLKYISRKNKNDNAMRYMNYAEGNTLEKFHYNQQVAAAYSQFTYRGEKWQGMAGLRYEHAYMKNKYPAGDLPDFHKRLNDWAPVASIRYLLNDAASLKLSYEARISRPGMYYLNPAVVSTPTTLSYGNPHLSSTKFHRMQLELWKYGEKLTLNLTPFYFCSNNGWGNAMFVEGGKKVFTFDQGVHSKYGGLSSYVEYIPAEKTRISFNTTLYDGKEESRSIGLSEHCQWGIANVGLSQMLPWKINMDVGGYFRFGHHLNSVYGYSTHPYTYDINLERAFLKDDRLVVSVYMQNPIGARYTKTDHHIVQGNYTEFSRLHTTEKVFAIRVAFRFGNLRTYVKRVEKSIENSDLSNGGEQKDKKL
ncbi:MAG: outer membrane beta-barrel protein [Prevotellaceae bacterium]|nr:outer membrane beta-barrel protein [Prevotellaceae bacterium]